MSDPQVAAPEPTAVPAAVEPAPVATNPAPTALAPAADPAPAAPTVIADPAPASEPAPAPATMPDNWRNLMAGEDEKTLKLLDRYKTPGDAAAALREAQQKIREGVSDKLPDEPTDDQIAAYRERNGIPEEHTGYELKMADGLVVGEEDKPLVDAVLQAMHGTNASPESVNAAVNAYYTMQEQAYADRELQDSQDSSATTQSLKDSWGPDYHGNMNAVRSLLNTVPENVREGIQSARMPDGSALFNSPEIMDWMAGISRKSNPAATVMPNSNNPVQAMTDELNQIEGWMKERSPKYWKDEKTQARYRELLDAQDAMR